MKGCRDAMPAAHGLTDAEDLDQALVGAPAHPREIVVTLRDGSRVTVRPIRPQDAAPLRAGFERLSDESRYRRFLSPMQELRGAMLRYLAEVDHHDHEALIAGGADGTILGVARSLRSRKRSAGCRGGGYRRR